MAFALGKTSANVWVGGGMGVRGEMKNRANMIDRLQQLSKKRYGIASLVT